MSELFDDIEYARRMQTSDVNGRPMSVAGKYTKDQRAIDGAPIGETYVIPSYTVPPSWKGRPFSAGYFYGADKRPLPAGPNQMIESKPVEQYGPHRAIWRGWRPHRPDTSYANLGMKMMEGERTYKLETNVPPEREMVEMASQNSIEPYHSVPYKDILRDRYRLLNIAEDKGVHGMGDLGADDAGTVEKVTSIAKDIADSIKKKYGGQTTPSGTTIPQPSGIPWGTIALVGAIGVAALFIVPKLAK